MYEGVEVLVLDLIPLPHPRHCDGLVDGPSHIPLKGLDCLWIVGVHHRLVKQHVALLGLKLEAPLWVDKTTRGLPLFWVRTIQLLFRRLGHRYLDWGLFGLFFLIII